MESSNLTTWQELECVRKRREEIEEEIEEEKRPWVVRCEQRSAWRNEWFLGKWNFRLQQGR